MEIRTGRLTEATAINRQGGTPIRTIKDAWGDFLIALFSGSYLILWYHFPVSIWDEGLILSAAERILRGQIPYRDFFSELGPGSFYIQAALFRIWGIDLTVVRLTVWALGIVLVWLVYRLSLKILSGPIVLIPALMMCCICYPALYWLSHHWWGVFFFLFAVLCLTGCCERLNGGGRKLFRVRLFVAGLLMTATLLSMQSLGVYGTIGILTWLLLGSKLTGDESWAASIRSGLGRATWFLAGAGLFLGAFLFYFEVKGALIAWIYDNFVFLLTNYKPYEISPGIYTYQRWVRLISWMVQGSWFHNGGQVLQFLYISVIAPVAGFASVTWQLARGTIVDKSKRSVLLLYLLCGFGALVSELHCPDMLQLFWAAPILLILFGYAWNFVLGRSGQLPRVASAIVVFAMIIIVGGRRGLLWHRTPVQTRRGIVYMDPQRAVETQQWISAMEQSVPEGGETFFFPYNPEFYFLTATRNPTPYDGLLQDFNSPSQFEEAFSYLRASRANPIFSFEHVMQWTVRAHMPDDLPDFFGNDLMERSLKDARSPYHVTETVAGMDVWSLK